MTCDVVELYYIKSLNGKDTGVRYTRVFKEAVSNKPKVFLLNTLLQLLTRGSK